MMFSCKEIENSPSIVRDTVSTNSVEYAEGFSIYEADNFITLTVKNPWPGSNESFT